MSESIDVNQPVENDSTQLKSAICFSELFEKRCESVLVFTVYVSLCSVQYVLVKASQTADHYEYNFTLVVFATEAFKLLMAAVFCARLHSLRTLVRVALAQRKLFLLYLTPSALYCVSNNLVFVNLQHFDPITYNVLQQLKIVFTGLLFQVIFDKKLSCQQWLAIVLLAVGCASKQLAGTEKAFESFQHVLSPRAASLLLLLLLQIGCTSLSGVCNEALIKRRSNGANDLHVMVHNLFIYIDSVVCNLFVLVCNGHLADVVNYRQLYESIFTQPLVVAVIINGAFGGIMVSVFLKHFDSVVRVFTASLEMTFMAVVCWFTFRTPIDQWTIIAIAIVSLATYLYVKGVNAKSTTASTHSADQRDQVGDKVGDKPADKVGDKVGDKVNVVSRV